MAMPRGSDGGGNVVFKAVIYAPNNGFFREGLRRAWRSGAQKGFLVFYTLLVIHEERNKKQNDGMNNLPQDNIQARKVTLWIAIEKV